MKFHARSGGFFAKNSFYQRIGYFHDFVGAARNFLIQFTYGFISGVVDYEVYGIKSNLAG